jgi:putative addiction module killer protein
MEIRKTDVFKKWMKTLKDAMAKARVDHRIDRLSMGNPGDVQPIGEGCSEMRIDHGPGYRVYYKEIGKETIVILCDGDKFSQQNDIANAKRLAHEEEEDDNENE